MHTSIPTYMPQSWGSHYELIDTGNFAKLERFGVYTVIRPEPQALWQPTLSSEEWNEQAHAVFKRDNAQSEKGQWHILKKDFKEIRWHIAYQHVNLQLKIKLSLSGFKHVGIFPEQAHNWEFMAQIIPALQKKHPQNPIRFLNLFAYTGVASLVAKQLGAEVTHLDAIKQTVSWARENMEISGIDNIRWIVDDALKFVQREGRRNNQYMGILLDPPAYGRGPEGEKWLLEEHIYPMLEACKEILHPEGFLILNTYSMGFSALVTENLLKGVYPNAQNREIAELFLMDKFNKKLPLGVVGKVY